ncbi:XRE family transcriptional regulator [Pseudoduganella sp. SL102]|uniref:helix-turn-helix domain-containing protein n=1 Tax=Pseudoduganella sp. SL102 TaxID=2995154 RepID=UPI00248B5964|nr:XRE family transcriptional regulator [Pseudoduganella sp. SL102]WBS00686.1 XRE family transcriptional regulator [Pseudoduganella sp. SL102]
MSNDLDGVIAKRLREERLARGWTLERLAAESAVSRAMISKIERNQTSPTAVLLARLTGAMNLTLTSLMSERGVASPSVRRMHDQDVWLDPQTRYMRRLVSGGDAEVEIVAIELPVGAVVEFGGLPGDLHEEQVLMLEGVLTLQAGQIQSSLHPGDVARFSADQVHVFSNHGQSVARYLVIKRQA